MRSALRKALANYFDFSVPSADRFDYFCLWYMMYFKTTSLCTTCPHWCVCAVNQCPTDGYKSGRMNLVSCPLPRVGCHRGGPESSDCGSCCFSPHISLAAMWRALMSLLLPALRVISPDSTEYFFPGTKSKRKSVIILSFTEAMQTEFVHMVHIWFGPSSKGRCLNGLSVACHPP